MIVMIHNINIQVMTKVMCFGVHEGRDEVVCPVKDGRIMSVSRYHVKQFVYGMISSAESLKGLGVHIIVLTERCSKLYQRP